MLNLPHSKVDLKSVRGRLDAKIARMIINVDARPSEHPKQLQPLDQI